MAKQSKLIDRERRKLRVGEQIQEHGIRYRARAEGDGTWFIRYRDAAGKLVEETVGKVSQGKTLAGATALLRDRQTAVEHEGFIFTPKRAKKALATVAVFFEAEYLPWSKASKRAWENDVQRYRSHIEPAFGDHPLDEVTRAEVERWKVALRTDHAPATVNRCFTLLRAMFNKAIAWNHLGESPCRGVRTLRENNERVRFLTEAELARLLEAATRLNSGDVVDSDGKKKRGNRWLRALITVAVNTGLRRGELFHLRWEDVDKDNRILTLRETKDGTTARLPFNDEVWLTLSTVPRVAGNPHVFPGRQGPLTDIKRAWSDALEMAGIQDFRFHDLRHTFASHLVMAGVDLNTVRELMRHKTLTMTLRYAHLAPEHRQAALAKIGAVYTRAAGAEIDGRKGHTRDNGEKVAETPRNSLNLVGETGLEPVTLGL